MVCPKPRGGPELRPVDIDQSERVASSQHPLISSGLLGPSGPVRKYECLAQGSADRVTVHVLDPQVIAPNPEDFAIPKLIGSEPRGHIDIAQPDAG